MRILIIEDEEDLVAALARGLRRQGYAVDSAADGETGWELAETNCYDLLILDLNLPHLDGLEICRRLRTTQPQLLIIMLTARTKPNQRVQGLDQGADDYLMKPFHYEELLARLRALLRRDLRVREPLLQYNLLKLDPASKSAWHNQSRLDLTNKEFGILEYLLRRPGELITQEELLEHVWDANANPFTSTVRVHINSLRRKLLEAAPSVTYIETMAGQGYRLNQAESMESLE